MIGTSRFLQKTARTEPTSILRSLSQRVRSSMTRDSWRRDELLLSHASDLPRPCQCHGSLCRPLLEAANLRETPRHRRVPPLQKPSLHLPGAGRTARRAAVRGRSAPSGSHCAHPGARNTASLARWSLPRPWPGSQNLRASNFNSLSLFQSLFQI